MTMHLSDQISPVLGASLAVLESRPCAFAPHPGNAIDPLQAHDAAAHSLMVLQTLALIENHDESDQTIDPHVARVERKVDLLISMVASLARVKDEGDARRNIEWSAKGAVIEVAGPCPDGTVGFLRIEPSPLLPAKITLPCVVRQSEVRDGKALMGLEFLELGDSLTSELEGHLFRVHRRAVADKRRLSAP